MINTMIFFEILQLINMEIIQFHEIYLSAIVSPSLYYMLQSHYMFLFLQE